MQVQALPLQSIILHPTPNARVATSHDGTLRVQGVAYPGAGGAPIEVVEVSADGGQSWHTATLLRDEVVADDARTPHHWLRWVARVPLGATSDLGGGRCVEPGADRPCTVCCRAFDTNGQSQPKVSPQQRGYLYNGWFHVDLTVTPSEVP